MFGVTDELIGEAAELREEIKNLKEENAALKRQIKDNQVLIDMLLSNKNDGAVKDAARRVLTQSIENLR